MHVKNLETLQSTLKAWGSIPPKRMPLDCLKTKPELQPRSTDSLQVKKRDGWKSASDHHVMTITNAIKAGNTIEPLLVAEIEGEFLIVDGHHRRRAHATAKATHALCRVLRTDMQTALEVSLVVNVGPTRLRMEDAQSRDALWRWLGRALDYGRKPDAKLPTVRDLEFVFGVPKSSIGEMIQKARTTKGGDYSAPACFPSDPWPRWRYVHTSKWAVPNESETDKQRRKLESAARDVLRLLAKHGHEVLIDLPAYLRKQAEIDKSDPAVLALAETIADLAIEEDGPCDF